MSRYDAVLNREGAKESMAGFEPDRQAEVNAANKVSDPHPALSEDSGLWDKLLQLACQHYPPLADPLLAIRKAGARLRRDNETCAIRASLVAGDSGLWASEAAYKADAGRLLGAHKDALVKLLANFNAIMGSVPEGAGDLATDRQVELIKQALEEKRICAIRSGALDGEVVYFAKSFADARKAPMGAVAYTLTELANLKECPPTVDELKQIHQVKRLFDGTVMAG